MSEHEHTNVPPLEQRLQPEGDIYDAVIEYRAANLQVDQLNDRVGSCKCVTKTPEARFHAPDCPYRIKVERDERDPRIGQLMRALQAGLECARNCPLNTTYHERVIAEAQQLIPSLFDEIDKLKLRATDVSQEEAYELQDVLHTIVPSGRAFLTSARELVGVMEKHRNEAQRLGRVVRQPAPEDFEVLVGNLGCVYKGENSVEAHAQYATYCAQSESNVGRAAGEDVTIMQGGEPIGEHRGQIGRVQDVEHGDEVDRHETKGGA